MVRRLTHLAGAAVCAAITVVTLGGCGREPAAPAPDAYTVQGVVEKLPQTDGPDRSVYIHHQPIPGFRDEHGNVVGMMSMTMPFPLGPGVSLAGIAVGDPVEFTFTVSWKGRAGYQITSIRKLPAGTTVDFGSR
jgi:Cu/Ag efflux protein CusF